MKTEHEAAEVEGSDATETSGSAPAPAKVPGSLYELIELLDGFDTAMLVTSTPDGLLRGRPMAVQDPRDMPDCDLWFVTTGDSPKAAELHQNHQVCVCAHRSIDHAWLSISARARVERDPERLKQLWKKSWDAWMPEGPEHPNTAILKLYVERAEYWVPSGGMIRVAFDVLRAFVTRKPATAFLEPHKLVERKRAA